MDICFEGVGQTAATFHVEDEVEPGMVVTMTGNGTVGLGEEDDLPCGVVLGGVRGGAAAVQIGGAAEVSYSGETAPTAGWQKLACDGTGGLQVAETGGMSCLVLKVDTTAKTAVVKL